MSSCSGDCSSCGSTSCGERTAESLLAQLNPKASVKKVIAVVSGRLSWTRISPALPPLRPSESPSARAPMRTACILP